MIPCNLVVKWKGKRYQVIAFISNANGTWFYGAPSGGKFDWLPSNDVTLDRFQ